MGDVIVVGHTHMSWANYIIRARSFVTVGVRPTSIR